jgi:DNA-binding NtrC family response regulator
VEGKENIMMFRDTRKGQFEWRNTIAPLLGDWVALLAMKHQRAPLPVSSALWKGLLRRGFPNDVDELAMFARRYLFLGDERLLLAELRIRTATTPPVRETLSKEREIAAEERPHIEDAHKCQ